MTIEVIYFNHKQQHQLLTHSLCMSRWVMHVIREHMLLYFINIKLLWILTSIVFMNSQCYVFLLL